MKPLEKWEWDFLIDQADPHTPCPVCGGAGIVDTSPPGVETAPWLQTDTDCPRCADTEESE